MKTIFFLCLLLLGCGARDQEEKASVNELGDLRMIFEARLSAYNEKTANEKGWPSTTDCDATLWAGLAKAAGAQVALREAEHMPGEIHRRPLYPCWDEVAGDQGSKATVSNDMITGYLWGVWRSKDREALVNLFDYAHDHDYIMGKPFPEMASRVVLKPNAISVLSRMAFAMAGLDDSGRHLPTAYLPVEEDYEEHLQVLMILLDGEVDSALRLTNITTGMKERLEALAAKRPDDALFQAALGRYTGDQKKTSELLRGPYQYPSYVRGHENYRDVHWLFAAMIALSGESL